MDSDATVVELDHMHGHCSQLTETKEMTMELSQVADTAPLQDNDKHRETDSESDRDWPETSGHPILFIVYIPDSTNSQPTPACMSFPSLPALARALENRTTIQIQLEW